MSRMLKLGLSIICLTLFVFMTYVLNTIKGPLEHAFMPLALTQTVLAQTAPTQTQPQETRIAPRQISGPLATTTATNYVMVYVPGTGAEWALINTSLILTGSGSTWSLGAAPQVGTPQLDSYNLSAAQMSFTLSYTPISAALVRVFVNGLYMQPGMDYTISGTVITFTATTPQSGDIVLADYNH